MDAMKDRWNGDDLLSAESQSRSRKRDFVYDAIKRSLIMGEYSLGEELVALKIATTFGTSRQPVMDALRKLQLDGFVEVVPQVGVRVVRPSPAGTVDYYRIFGALEGIAAEMAAERRTASGLVILRNAVELSSRMVEEDPDLPMEEYLSLNRRVHRAIHFLAQPGDTLNIARTYWDRSDFLMAITSKLGPKQWFLSADHEHHAILDAIANGDGSSARELATQHLVSIGGFVAEKLTEL
ncbi:transcriptional regulator (plasmid) [Pseudarthrobacter phenanthrenivorans Sphe3]|uniref:Transcriptional regulator n=1 Tax=Pseudarthrobacter phenanthrenivorans (strain DSM 18606 / JCM 16027 / LMG 23796 / Sphe3) TaxID=930171 RepID=F0MC30_PSEPM|nr:GntR family transcriptional regulator [Pseudarthrobacter phenanthrenivorans]ADX75086.1 transcriptional regulator [Pseudarthrobacter phenanthrenivorans Sphe3]